MDTPVMIRILLVVVAASVLFALVNCYSKPKETFQEVNYEQANWRPSETPVETNADYRPVDFETERVPTDCFPRDRNTAEDLLPKDAANSKWAQVNPAGQGDIKNVNFLTAGHHIGINTVGSTMKNPNLQLRSDPYIPVGRWPIMNSSIEPDLLRRPFDIGLSPAEGCEKQ